jgi:hypothetical protein
MTPPPKSKFTGYFDCSSLSKINLNAVADDEIYPHSVMELDRPIINMDLTHSPVAYSNDFYESIMVNQRMKSTVGNGESMLKKRRAKKNPKAIPPSKVEVVASSLSSVSSDNPKD